VKSTNPLENLMLNFAKVCCLCVAIALILAFSGVPTHAGLSTNCVAADGIDPSLLLQVKKNKKHSGQSQNDSGLTNCKNNPCGQFSAANKWGTH
jgi:hypothetical protein